MSFVRLDGVRAECLRQVHKLVRDHRLGRCPLVQRLEVLKPLSAFPRPGAETHACVCDHYAIRPAGSDEHTETVRFVARTTLGAWEQCPYNGETFVSVAAVWMEGYDERLNAELAP